MLNKTALIRATFAKFGVTTPGSDIAAYIWDKHHVRVAVTFVNLVRTRLKARVHQESCIQEYELPEGKFRTILADPPWQFDLALTPYKTMTLDEILALPVPDRCAYHSHLYLWCPNALLLQGLRVMGAWGFRYKAMLTWVKVVGDAIDGRGSGKYFKNVTEQVLFGIRGNHRTSRLVPNVIKAARREHSRKPDELYDIIEACSRPPYLELFARHERIRWTQFGDELPLSQPASRPLQQETTMDIWYYANHYKGIANNLSKAKWYKFEGTWTDFMQHLLGLWDAQPTHLFSHRIGLGGGKDKPKIAKTSQIDQIGVVRRNDVTGNLEWHEGAESGVVLGPCKRACVEYIQQETSVAV